MTEMGAALRQFADLVDQGKILNDATDCCVVLVNANTQDVKVTHIGRMAPAKTASLLLLSAGVHKVAMSERMEMPQ